MTQFMFQEIHLETGHKAVFQRFPVVYSNVNLIIFTKLMKDNKILQHIF